ncbi:MAG: hypothetical protein C0602_02500 [Denitrovibrio sp.]|nr:MAG: hypothetical protein C0602_02500 [Denitrovibrio sp.]
MENKQLQFKKYYFITSFALIFVIIVGMGAYFVSQKYKSIQQYALSDKIANVENKKTILKSIVDSFAQQVEILISESEASLDQKLKNRVNTAYNISMGIYNEMQGKFNKNEIKNAVRSALSSMTFDKDYIFCIDYTGDIVSSPFLPHIEGKNFIDKTDSEGNFILKDAIEIARNEGAGYQNTYWVKPGEEERGPQKKRVFVKNFEPLDWVIGYGEYTDSFQTSVQEDVLLQLEAVTYENDGYLFATTYEGYSLTKPAKGKNMYDVRDVNGKYIVRELISKAKEGGGFIIYVMPPFKGARPESKLSYAAPIERWGWYIGAGMYLTDIEAAYEKRLETLSESSKKDMAFILVGVMSILALAAFAIFLLSGKLQKIIDAYNEEIKNKNEELENLNLSLEEKVSAKTSELNELNQSLEEKVREEVAKNREKDRIMFKQGRLAAMGEMIGNIAHQWRQPLSSISFIVQDIQEAKDTGELDDEYLNASVVKCTKTIGHMSETIDNFRDFFSPAKEQIDFSVNNEIEKSLQLIDATLENNRIKVNVKLSENIIVHGIAGEYSQVLVSIINNAKDVLLARSVEDPEISIESGEEDGASVVTICDNAGGVDEEIIEKIFEPYFTTKPISQGTGIGLYFSKMIIEGNMHGSLTVYNGQKGACFKISVAKV